ncbi:MAG: electron transfer flavoprotein subunit beta/FixA family protein [Thermoleophilia bacterium]
MRLLVLLESADDVRIPPRRDRRSGRLRAEWQVRRLDPAGARALDAALALKAAQPGTEVLAMLLGPEGDDTFLREALARGCDEAVRIWDEECLHVHAPGKALILAAAARVLQCDLVLAGAASAATAGAQVGVLVAAHLGVPCVTQVAGLDTSAAGAAGGDGEGEAAGIRATRALAGGFREVVEVSLPAAVTCVPADPDSSAAPLPAVLGAHARGIPEWDLAELGVPREDVLHAEGSLRYGRLRTPRPAVRCVPAPDPAAPAFDRIAEIVRGTVRRRDGRVSTGPADELAEQLFRALRDGGWLDRPGRGETE